MGRLKNKQFINDLKEFSSWLEKRVRKGMLKKNSAVVQKSIVKNWLVQLEKKRIRDYTDGYLSLRTYKDDVIRRFIEFTESKKMKGKTVITPFGIGLVDDRVVVDSSPEVYLKVKLNSGELVIVPYGLVGEV